MCILTYIAMYKCDLYGTIYIATIKIESLYILTLLHKLASYIS